MLYIVEKISDHKLFNFSTWKMEKNDQKFIGDRGFYSRSITHKPQEFRRFPRQTHLKIQRCGNHPKKWFEFAIKFKKFQV